MFASNKHIKLPEAAAKIRRGERLVNGTLIHASNDHMKNSADISTVDNFVNTPTSLHAHAWRNCKDHFELLVALDGVKQRRNSFGEVVFTEAERDGK